MLSINDIVNAIAADFEVRGIESAVQFGGWKKDYAVGPARVVLALDTYASDAPGLPNAPGMQFTDGPGNTTAARSLFTRVQSVKVWVHGTPPPARDPKRSENAEKATAILLHATLRAMYQIAHGSFGWGGGEWPTDERQDFVYGSVTSFTAQFSIPVLDDEHQAVTPDAGASTTETIAVLANGDVTVAITP